jgi:hypothetical protein
MALSRRLASAALVAALCAAPASAAEQPLRESIDAEIQNAWKQKNIAPPAPADDATFLRRVYLDLVGTIPTYDEGRKFLQDDAADKRSKLIDRLLDDPRFAAHQADVWDLAFFGRNVSDEIRKRDAFKKWLADKFAKNEPYDHWVRDLLLAEQDGSEMFYVQFRGQPEEAAVAVSRIFLGVQLQCARCHDHPFENWKQREFYGMAGFFVRLAVLESGDGPQRRLRIGEKTTGEVLFTGSAKELKPGQKGEPVKPKFLGGAELDEPAPPKDYKEPEIKAGTTLPKPAFSRKEKLAEWVVDPDNPYFARAVANRVWAQFMGRGLVQPVDDIRDKNPPICPDLFAGLAAQVKAHQYDLKWYIRELVNSSVYQASSAGPSSAALPDCFERARVRPLSAEEMLAAFRTATGFDDAGQKIGGDTVAYFERYFGEPTNGQGEFQGGLTEHLFLNNSEQISRMIHRTKGNLADAILTSTDPWEQRVDRLFLSVLSRPPRPDERQRFVAHLTSDPKAAEPLVDEAIWVLLNTAEFRFNH